MSLREIDLQNEILRLKREKNALILAHYYQALAVQDLADFVGDSFQIAKLAKESASSTVIICGVLFMAESAKILSPGKTILLPAPDAGCPLADMVIPEDVLALKEAHPKAPVLCYINSSAAVKALADICCTSSTALHIAKNLDAEEIIFIPDQNLGRYLARQIPEKRFHLSRGFCPIHHRITKEQAIKAKALYPQAPFAAHPECQLDVLDEADFIGNTAQIIDFARKTAAREIIIGTELGVLDLLAREMPEKKILSVSSSFVCPNMKKTDVRDVHKALTTGQHEITLDPEERIAARKSLDAMIALCQ